jgi:hypothetical protein
MAKGIKPGGVKMACGDVCVGEECVSRKGVIGGEPLERVRQHLCCWRPDRMYERLTMEWLSCNRMFDKILRGNKVASSASEV